MSLIIRGIGTAVPPHTLSQPEATELAHDVFCRSAQERKTLAALYRLAGVQKRHCVLPHRIAYNWLPPQPEGQPADARPTTAGPTTAERMRYYAEHAPPLAAEAARHALTTAAMDHDLITHLITVTCTGFDAPGVDVALIERLNLPQTTQRIQVGFMGCHGAINGLRVAQALTTADPRARVLLLAIELCTLHYRFQWDPERIVANALFADGAAAVVGSAVRPNESTGRWSVAATGSCLIPDSQDAMSWRIGDHGFEMTLAAPVPELIKRHLRSWLAAWLDQHGHSLASIRSWAIHPGGPRILGAVEESLGLPREATAVSREVLASHGNMSSPTVLFILNRLRAQHAPLPCVALGFGPGLFAEAALFV